MLMVSDRAWRENMSENEKLSEFYEELTQAQEELGAEFSKVLFDNLWDLYD